MHVVSNETIDKILEFRSKYSKMISDLKKTMEKYIDDPKNDYSVEDTIINLCSADNGLSVFSTDESLRKATTVSEVFLFISQHCSMYDYEVLKVYINSTECKDAIKLLEDFTTQLQNSLLKHLNLLSDNLSFESSILPNGKERKLTIECRGKSLKCEDKDLIQNIVCEKFDLPEASLQFVSVMLGSVHLIYEISEKVKEHLLQHKVTADVARYFFACHIIRFIIDNEIELKVSADHDKVCSYMFKFHIVTIINT